MPLNQTTPPQLLLASQSPRRSELLSQIGINFSVVLPKVLEQRGEGESPRDYVARLSEEKAVAGWKLSDRALPVLGADTVVVCESDVLEKPANKSEAMAMLLKLSGRKHQVMSGVTIVSDEGITTEVSTTDVTFKSISEGEVERYWETDEPKDKAGSYGIQGLGAVFVESINGSYSNVVGLPIEILPTMFAVHGVTWWLVK